MLIDHPSVVDKWSKQNRSKIEADVKAKAEYEEKILRFFAGCGTLADELDDNTDQNVNKEEDNNKDTEIAYTPKPTGDNIETLKIPVFFPNYYTGIDDKTPNKDVFIGYMLFGTGVTLETLNNYGYEMQDSGSELKTPIVNKTNKNKKWYYAVDDKYAGIILEIDRNYKDNSGFTLNKVINKNNLDQVFVENTFDFTSDGKGGYLRTYSFYDLYTAFKGTANTPSGQRLRNILLNGNITGVRAVGCASLDGNKHQTGEENKRGQKDNETLSQNRAKVSSNWAVNEIKTLKNVDVVPKLDSLVMNDVDTGGDVSSLKAKLARCAIIEIDIQPDSPQDDVIIDSVITAETPTKKITTTKPKNVLPDLYDDEYVYFEHLKEEDTFLHNKIVDKVKFFDPAFHSITPEGFNSRLTFLNQCTRQGPTIKNGASGMGAGNLAFGRAPYCVLRIGDFYNTKICIDSITISYDNGGGVQWDLNPEGAGVQPMYADVNINFRFIGGSDLSGPIEKLQNAVSFNYYSNTSVYDRRSDLRRNFVNAWDNETEKRDSVLS